MSPQTMFDLSANWQSTNGLRFSVYLQTAFDKRRKTFHLNLAVARGWNAEAYGRPRS